MQYIILLTGCINPEGMPFTALTNSDIRQEQYINAINFYLKETFLPIVFVENSGIDISNFFKSSISNKRLEILTFDGNKQKWKGKGYGEAKIIEYALAKSHFIVSTNNHCYLIKITGRLIIKNINAIIKKRFCFQNINSVLVSFNSKFTMADSRFIIAPKPFYKLFLYHKEEINDYENRYFEMVLSDCIKHNNDYYYFPFYIEPQIYGTSGSTSQEYACPPSSLKRRIIYLSYATYSILRFDKTHSKLKIGYISKLYYKTIYYALILAQKVMNKIIT